MRSPIAANYETSSISRSRSRAILGSDPVLRDVVERPAESTQLPR